MFTADATVLSALLSNGSQHAASPHGACTCVPVCLLKVGGGCFCEWSLAGCRWQLCVSVWVWVTETVCVCVCIFLANASGVAVTCSFSTCYWHLVFSAIAEFSGQMRHKRAHIDTPADFLLSYSVQRHPHIQLVHIHWLNFIDIWHFLPLLWLTPLIVNAKNKTDCGWYR